MPWTSKRDVQFQHADPPWRVPHQLPTSFAHHESVRPGDIIYLRRPRKFQWVAYLMGDTWRHIGVATIVHGDTWMVEMNPFGFYGRPLSAVIDMYDTVAVQQITPCQHASEVPLDLRIIADMRRPTTFHTKPEMVAIGVFGWLRLFHLGPRRENLRQRLWNLVVNREGFKSRAVCSTPVARAVKNLCRCHPIVLDAWSYKRGAQRQQTLEDHLYAAVPDDVWRALEPLATSFWLKKDGVFPNSDHVIDLSSSRKEATP